MRILKKNFKKGFVKVIPKTLDDLWHLYNVIYKGDLVYSRTTREVKIDVEYSRPQKGKRISVFLSVLVEDVIWDRSLNRLRVHGTIDEAPEKIAGRGTHHTLNIAVNTPITIVKNKWSKHQMDRLERAKHFEGPPLVVVSIDTEEYCIGMIREFGVNVHVQNKARLPGKLEAQKRDTALQKYLGNAAKALRELVGKNDYPIAIIGVGFTKKQFLKYVESETPEIAKAIIDVKSVNNSGIAGIQEALRSGVLNKALGRMRIAEESRIIEDLLERLGKEKGTATYGVEQVEKAKSFGAVEKLLVADFTIRDASDEKRLALERLMREVEERGGSVIVISIEHEAGQKLQSLGGIAALLRFSIS